MFFRIPVFQLFQKINRWTFNMTKILNEKSWHVRTGIHYRGLADGGMLFDADGHCVHHLNASAAGVWEICQKGAQLTEIIDALWTRFDVSREELEKDIKEILGKFEEAGLLLE